MVRADRRILRAAQPVLEGLLRRFPAVALIGPRQCGKTTLAQTVARLQGRSSIYLDLEAPSDLARLADPEHYLRSQKGALVVLDEVHRAPGLFGVLRGLIDRQRAKGRRAGQFLLLGSASIELLRQSAESLAGRIAYLELTPFLERELPPERGAREPLWVRGGFPDSLLAAGDAASFEWRQAFIRTYLERDIPQLGPRIPAETLRRFWTMLAHEQGQMVSHARIAAGLGVSGQTVSRYLDLMTDLLLVRSLRPWSRNVRKRLVRSPKVYVRDSGIAHALLGLRTRDDVLAHPVAGPSWEGYVIENLCAAAPRGTASWFYRSAAGAEIDLVLEVPGAGTLAIEIKRSLAPALSKGFVIACEDLRARRRYLVYPGTESFALDRRTTALPLKALVAELARHR
jgi:hypothetical protein